MAAPITFSLSGDAKLKAFFTTFRTAALQALGRQLFREGEEIMTLSKEHFVPVLTGALRASGQVGPPEITDPRVVVTLGYGNSAVHYAVPVHERLEVRHHIGGPKYLERPVLQRSSGMGERIAARLKAELEARARG